VVDGRASMTCGQISEVITELPIQHYKLNFCLIELNELSLIDERSTAILRHVLESEYSATIGQSSFSPSAGSSIASLDKVNFNKLRDGYTACMNEGLLAQRGLEPLLKLVNELKGIYPLAESSEAKEKPKKPESSTEGVTDAIAYLQELGIAGFIDFGISVGPRLCPWLLI